MVAALNNFSDVKRHEARLVDIDMSSWTTLLCTGFLNKTNKLWSLYDERIELSDINPARFLLQNYVNMSPWKDLFFRYKK